MYIVYETDDKQTRKGILYVNDSSMRRAHNKTLANDPVDIFTKC